MDFNLFVALGEVGPRDQEWCLPGSRPLGDSVFSFLEFKRIIISLGMSFRGF